MTLSEKLDDKLFKANSIRVVISFKLPLGLLGGSIIGDQDEKDYSQWI